MALICVVIDLFSVVSWETFDRLKINHLKSQSVKVSQIERQRALFEMVQSGASSLVKHGDAYFSAVYGSIQDPIAAPGPCENQEF